MKQEIYAQNSSSELLLVDYIHKTNVGMNSYRMIIYDTQQDIVNFYTRHGTSKGLTLDKDELNNRYTFIGNL